mmetsp:Transcript_27439/g.65981  ORF Transcript_27439/g.65981 Transcript_27439/m.65981 type:complete len:208 (+) Transcript_27439:262-885(+)|eukprot:CAMPEP_0181101244 /NCGR_PEP_ID=MMETSP1071-20121207/13645_1 /TAXON_ID=35127 /ORGANISM="Thalassiosira sp., Strain NH16" /LENGTH=207 /DNA_ID=CAMNT_0023184071 /DNA_START=29 /DNA_END=652 /DNA_ORIENTATION=+
MADRQKRLLHDLTHRADASASFNRGFMRSVPSLTTIDGSFASVVSFFIKFALIVPIGVGLVCACFALMRSRAEVLPDEHVALGVAAAMCWFTNIPPTIGLVAISPVGYDNANSREQKNHSTGWIYRCWAAHLNHHENFPIFAAGLWSATRQGMAPLALSALAWSWVLLRMGYVLACASGHDGLRTLVWFCSWCAAMSLYGGVWFGID